MMSGPANYNTLHKFCVIHYSRIFIKCENRESRIGWEQRLVKVNGKSERRGWAKTRAFSECMNIFPFILFFRMDPILTLICLPIKSEKSMVVDSLLNDYAIHFDFPSVCVCLCVRVRSPHFHLYYKHACRLCSHAEYYVETRSPHSLYQQMKK